MPRQIKLGPSRKTALAAGLGGGAAQFMNLKQIFQDALRQRQWKLEDEYLKSQEAGKERTFQAGEKAKGRLAERRQYLTGLQSEEKIAAMREGWLKPDTASMLAGGEGMRFMPTTPEERASMGVSAGTLRKEDITQQAIDRQVYAWIVGRKTIKGYAPPKNKEEAILGLMSIGLDPTPYVQYIRNLKGAWPTDMQGMTGGGGESSEDIATSFGF